MDVFKTCGACFAAFPEPVLLVSGGNVLFFNDAARRLFPLADFSAGVPAELAAILPDLPTAFLQAGCSFGARRFSLSGTPMEGGLLLVLRPEPAVEVLSGQLLGALSDHLRAPLSALLAASSLLAPAVEGNSQHETYLSIINQYHYRLFRLVGNLDTLHRLSREETDPAFVPVNTDAIPLLEYLCDAADGLARLIGRRVALEANREQLILALDVDSFSRMLLNLLSNSLKHAPEGSTVLVRAERGDSRLILSVRDPGEGLDQSDLSTVFFYSDAPGSLSAGPGLGLVLVRKIAEKHGGSALLHSVPGEGTTVTVALPIRRLEEDTLRSYRPPDGYGGFNRVLVELSDVLPPEAFALRDLE